MLKIKIIILLLYCFFLNDSFAQKITFNLNTYQYYYSHYYNPIFIKVNQVKSLEINHIFQDSKKSELLFMSKSVFDSLGRTIMYREYNKNKKLISNEICISSIKEVKNYDTIQKKKFTLYISNINSVSLKEVIKSNIKNLTYFTDSTISYYHINKNRLYLEQINKFDKYGNSTLLKFVSYKKTIDTTTISFDFNYERKTFKSYTFINNEKILVSMGELNGNNRIISEYFFWLPYYAVHVNHPNYDYPKEIITYSIDQKGLIHQYISIHNNLKLDLKLTSGKINTSDINTKVSKNIVKMRYEYYK